MSYIPHTWTSNELITAEKMNALEQGIANCCNGVLYVNFLNDYMSNTKTSDVITALNRGCKVILKYNDSATSVSSISYDEINHEYNIEEYQIPESHLNDPFGNYSYKEAIIIG